MKTSRASVFLGSGQAMQVCDLPVPSLAVGEALVRVTMCMLCASDVHTYFGRRTSPCPTVLGHEAVGEIASIGEGAVDHAGAPLAMGERVTWSVAAHCGLCFFCKHNLPQKCERLFKYGHERLRPGRLLVGALGEYCHLVTGTTIVKVPPTIPDDIAGPANCAAATAASAVRLSRMKPGEVVLVQGAGMLGLMACAMASAGGAREVVVVDPDATRLERAMAFGATRVLLAGPDVAPLAQQIGQWTGGRGADAALEMSGDPSAAELGINLLRVGGRYVLVGAVYPARPMRLAGETIVRQMLHVRGLHNYAPDDLVRAVRFLADHHHRYAFGELVDRRFALDEVSAAFEHAAQSGAVRVAVEPGRLAGAPPRVPLARLLPEMALPSPTEASLP